MKNLFKAFILVGAFSFTACDMGADDGSRSSSCPTTKNCGCSGYSKSVCADSCCRWVIGSGCKCR
jgi:uncharacterized protein (DUF1499 family)